MAETSYYQDRLYFNDVNGNFTHHPSALHKMFDSGSCLDVAEYGKDRDIDLFVEGRHHLGNYPLPGKSYLLQNVGGRFVDVSADAAGREFIRMGMVASALCNDIDNDGKL